MAKWAVAVTWLACAYLAAAQDGESELVMSTIPLNESKDSASALAEDSAPALAESTEIAKDSTVVGNQETAGLDNSITSETQESTLASGVSPYSTQDVIEPVSSAATSTLLLSGCGLYSLFLVSDAN
eukprot:Gregarina_sp_Poly_1__6722@NODE_3618_length_974_cov_625_982359_g2304_i0_p1_GENE_NODE_3618_length_974_cov_625_982359_g2304_i0NODE_3618_length_974_cov_625_982359_g2304_i0_p1_ORF_typecomplete_len127_score20_93LPAM_2/PF13627_6/0_88_NODE_3618_length_974_cov_625_982359_g2304_i0509889